MLVSGEWVLVSFFWFRERSTFLIILLFEKHGVGVAARCVIRVLSYGLGGGWHAGSDLIGCLLRANFLVEGLIIMNSRVVLD